MPSTTDTILPTRNTQLWRSRFTRFLPAGTSPTNAPGQPSFLSLISEINDADKFMKVSFIQNERGNVLLCAICTIFVISLIAANVLLNCTARYNQRQTRSVPGTKRFMRRRAVVTWLSARSGKHSPVPPSAVSPATGGPIPEQRIILHQRPANLMDFRNRYAHGLRQCERAISTADFPSSESTVLGLGIVSGRKEPHLCRD